MAQFEQDGVIYEDLGNGQVKVVGYANAQPANMTIGTPRPKEAPSGYRWGFDGSLQKIPGGPADKPEADPNAPKLPAGYRMKAGGTAELIPGVAAPKGGDVTARIRSDALQAFNDATALRRAATKLRQLNKTGPGATKGFGSVYDYLPTETNQGFNDASQRARGYVKRSLGFTSGEGNTLAESSSLYDPYLPSTYDKDGNILGKITALEGLAADAERKAIATLGGVPDQFGNITQPQQAAPQAAQGNQASAPQNTGPRNAPMIGGVPADSDIQFNFAKPEGGFDRNAWLQSNFGITPNQEAGMTAFLKANRGNPNFKYDDIAAFYKGVGAPAPQNDPSLINSIRAGNVNVTGFDSTQAEKAYQDALAQRVKERDTTAGAFDTVGRTGANALFGAGDRLSAGLDTLTGGGSYSDNLARQRFESDAAREANPLAALVGDVGGAILTTTGMGRFANNVATRFMPSLARTGAPGSSLARNVANDMAYGAGYGLTEQGDPVTAMLMAGGGSVAGQYLGKGLQKGLQGSTDAGVQYLTSRGIPLSLGELLGQNSAIGRQMQRMESLPFLGDMMHARRGDAKDAVFNATLNDAVAPSGQQVTGQGVDALSSAQGIKNQAYTDAYSNINAPIDAQYLQEVAPFIRGGRGIYGDLGGEFDSVVKGQLRPTFGPNRALDGPSAQQFGQTVNDFASDFSGRGAYGKIAGDNMRGIGNVTEDLIARTNPSALPKMQAANQINARLTPIENAMITARDVPTPKQLRAAYTQNTKMFGGRAAAARGDQVPDVVRYAADIAPNMNDSGSAGRLAGIAPFILPTALGGGAATLESYTDSPVTTGLLATLAAMSTKGGQKAVQNLIVRRPDSVRRVGGMFGRGQTQEALGSTGGAAALSYYGN